MIDDDRDRRVRLHAFSFVERLSDRWGTELPWKELAQGFELDGQRITLLGARGIWKPAAMDLPISITTSHRDPYGDTADNDGFLQYKYFGTDPMHPDKRGLRTCFVHARPLIYFRGIAKGWHTAHVIEIRADILDEVDGPMLRHGLQELNGGVIKIPRRSVDQPDPERLEERYERFRAAS